VTGEAVPVGRRDWLYRYADHLVAVSLLAITAIAAALRFSTLGVQSLSHDDAVTAVRVLQPTLNATLHVVSQLERSPPLDYILAWTWTKPLGFGTDPVGLRALSAVIGTLTVPFAYLAGRALASRRAGLIAAALVAINPCLVWYSQTTRSYPLLVLLSALALWLFARALRRPTVGAMALWAIAAALSLTSHYFAVFVVLPEAAWLLAATRPRWRAALAVAAVAAAGLALTPLAIMQEGGGSGSRNHFANTPVLKRGARSLLNVTLGDPAGWSTPLMISAGIVVAVLAVAAVLLVRRYATRTERRGAWAALSIALTALVIPLLLAYGGADFVAPRNMIGLVLPLLVAGAIAFGTVRSGNLGLAIAGTLMAVFAAVVVRVNLDPAVQRIDWRGAANAIGTASVSRAVVVPRLGLVPIQYYLHGSRRFTLGDHPTPIRVLQTLSTHPGPPHPAHGFKHVRTRSVASGEYWLSTFRARRPVPVRATQLVNEDLIGEKSRSLLTGVPRRH
jgi:mannosyltransferase